MTTTTIEEIKELKERLSRTISIYNQKINDLDLIKLFSLGFTIFITQVIFLLISIFFWKWLT